MFTQSLPNLNLWGIDNRVYLWYSLVMLSMGLGKQLEIDTMSAKHSVWGPVQTEKSYGEGITHVTTAGHGGFVLSPEMNEHVKVKFPDFKPWGGHERSYEEDCDWAVVVATFPDRFPSSSAYLANNTIRNRPEYYGRMVDIGIDDHGQPFAYDTEPLPALS